MGPYIVVGRMLPLPQEVTSEFPEPVTTLSYMADENADVIKDREMGRLPWIIRVGPM